MMTLYLLGALLCALCALVEFARHGDKPEVPRSLQFLFFAIFCALWPIVFWMVLRDALLKARRSVVERWKARRLGA